MYHIPTLTEYVQDLPPDEAEKYLREVLSKTWHEGRESVAIDMIGPTLPDGMKAATKDPYA